MRIAIIFMLLGLGFPKLASSQDLKHVNDSVTNPLEYSFCGQVAQKEISKKTIVDFFKNPDSVLLAVRLAGEQEKIISFTIVIVPSTKKNSMYTEEVLGYKGSTSLKNALLGCQAGDFISIAGVKMVVKDKTVKYSGVNIKVTD